MDQRIATLITRLRAHPVYEAVRTGAALRTSWSGTCVCVRDLMSLVKSLHRDVVGWTLPWVPPRNAQAARLLNEIVLAAGAAAARVALWMWNAIRADVAA